MDFEQNFGYVARYDRVRDEVPLAFDLVPNHCFGLSIGALADFGLSRAALAETLSAEALSYKYF